MKNFKEFLAHFRWTKTSYYLMSGFIFVILLIIIVWWPLAEDYLSLFDPNLPIWIQIDWLLIAIFFTMSLFIMARADLKKDIWIIIVGTFGGLVIESWGTQTEIWTYYTLERPPLWIIPAWPIASLSIDRIFRLLNKLIPEDVHRIIFKILYWMIFPAFYILLLQFVFPTIEKSMTIFAVTICTLLIISPTDYRSAVLTFLAGSALGYFLERWGTTRACWTYYSLETPPVFAVFAHGLAAVAFWRSVLILQKFIKPLLSTPEKHNLTSNRSPDQ